MVDTCLDSLILWYDASLLVVNKPAGLLSLADGYDASLPHLRSLLQPQFGPLWIVHRLDKDTSGVIVLARNAEAHRCLNTQLQEGSMVKIYHALVVGCPPWENHSIDLPLRANVGHRHRTVVDLQRGKPALTECRLLKCLSKAGHASSSGYALIEARPHSGRTHQIRAHLAHLGFPILADPLYGSPLLREARPAISLKRCGLHAYSLTLRHPTSAEKLNFQAAYPEDFANMLRQLEAAEIMSKAPPSRPGF